MPVDVGFILSEYVLGRWYIDKLDQTITYHFYPIVVPMSFNHYSSAGRSLIIQIRRLDKKASKTFDVALYQMPAAYFLKPGG
ncbi:hypothetical protein CWM47_02525 [Spirosoma pollinicola]|uniref:Uncharacterized protein n=1 Tax=Spirosoma pollinicola TaxID=2057025 RepID=A0A2K8YT80_9BACT|nr:hypothetical protein CWM47_02525 [Spirosoma pollinicola]